MMTTSLRTQSVAGCTIFLITSGLLFTGKCEKGTIQQRVNLLQNQDVSLNSSYPSLYEYQVTLTSGEKMYILARNSMDAAYSALELSEDRKANLLNVRIVDEWNEQT